MLNKFGTFYKYKKAAYIKKLNKIQKAQENEEEPIGEEEPGEDVSDNN